MESKIYTTGLGERLDGFPRWLLFSLEMLEKTLPFTMRGEKTPCCERGTVISMAAPMVCQGPS